jgi:hypothetical protein
VTGLKNKEIRELPNEELDRSGGFEIRVFQPEVPVGYRPAEQYSSIKD